MSTKDDGGPAFPQPATADGYQTNTPPGMSLRDWFAGMAVQGILQVDELRPSTEKEMGHLAMRVYQLADAMLEARKK